jgi:mono/diheme cytochrome c family protein
MRILSNFAESFKLTLQKIAILAVSFLIALPACLTIAVPPAAAAPAQEGQAIFQQSCASCHTADGSGAAFGPDLKGVTDRRDTGWLVRWISAPDEMISQGDPIASELLQQYSGVPMPNMGLQKPQIEAVLAYLATQNDSQTAPALSEPAEAPATAPQKGNPQIGKQLFTGTLAFHNSAPACMSCHSVNTVGALKGGTLGPDLTHVFGRYGATGLSSVLQTLPFPTMQGIYQNKPLTEEEQANLLAFFESANSAEPPVAPTGESKDTTIQNLLTPSWAFALIGLGGFLLLVLLSNFTWRDRFQGVRQRLVGEKQ